MILVGSSGDLRVVHCSRSSRLCHCTRSFSVWNCWIDEHCGRGGGGLDCHGYSRILENTNGVPERQAFQVHVAGRWSVARASSPPSPSRVTCELPSNTTHRPSPPHRPSTPPTLLHRHPSSLLNVVSSFAFIRSCGRWQTQLASHGELPHHRHSHPKLQLTPVQSSPFSISKPSRHSTAPQARAILTPHPAQTAAPASPWSARTASPSLATCGWACRP